MNEVVEKVWRGAPRYVRTRGGRMIHLATCRHVRPGTRSHPWLWAEGLTREGIRLLLRQQGIVLDFCRTCLPGPTVAHEGPIRIRVVDPPD